MNNFNGISAEAFNLLAVNRFENRKEFYDEHKEEIKKSAIIPMRMIAENLLDDMYEYDSKMVLNPVKMVSRIRRDTRYSKDKTLYRENIWIMFMRDKKINPVIPAFWFEVYPDNYSYGVGMFYTDAKFLQLYRDKLLKEQKRFLNAVKSCESVGAKLHCNSYKKPKSTDVPSELLPYYNIKNFYFIFENKDMSAVENGDIIDELKNAYKAYSPMYKFLSEVTDDYIALKGGDEYTVI